MELEQLSVPSTEPATQQLQRCNSGIATDRLPPQEAADTITANSPNAKSGKRKNGGATVAELADSTSNITSRCLVYCRLRPKNTKELADDVSNLVKVQGNKQIVIKDERSYDFDGIFNENSTQEQLFDAIAVPCIQHAFNGFCSALMCYGQTGTGKSYTMCNTDPLHEGIIPRASRYIFDRIEEAQGSEAGRCYTVIGQFVQIYRDHLGDLMSECGKSRVEIHYDRECGVALDGCSSHTLRSSKEFMKFYREGNSRRVVTATAMNPESSRGHTALIIWIFSENTDDPMQGRTRGKIIFIDLAGYERFSKTGISHSNPIMKDEAKTINASLLALGHVVGALSSGSKHIPWRNAKLTRILQDSIGGRSRTSIILTIGPSSNHLYETTNTLQFGLRARAVKVLAKVSVTVDYEKLAQKLMGMLDERDARINVLELQLASQDAARLELLECYQRDRAELEARFASDLEHLTTIGASEEQIIKLKEVYNAEMQNLQDQQTEELTYQDEIHTKEIAQLVNEQKHQEAKDLTAMKLAQDNIIEEFQSKLESARCGTNDDLIQALQQLTAKDVLLENRANEIAGLHAHIETLDAQIRELGAEPARPFKDALPESFLDVSQVEEIKASLHAEVERLRNKLVDLQTQLDRMTLLCSDRNDEIHALLEENQRLCDELAKTGAEVATPAKELPCLLRVKRAQFIGPDELETLRLRMQADLDEVTSQRDAMEREVLYLKERLATHASHRHKQPPSGAAVPDRFEDSLTARAIYPTMEMGASGTAFIQKATQALPTPRMQTWIEKLNRDLAESGFENAALTDRVQYLESVLAAHGILVDSPHGTRPHTEGKPLDMADSIAGASPCISTMFKSSALGREQPEVALTLSTKDAELHAMEEILLKQEKSLVQTRTMLECNKSYIEALQLQLVEAGLKPQEPVAGPPLVEGLALGDYVALLRELRCSNRRLTLYLLKRVEGATTATSDNSLEQDDKALTFEAELRQRDEQLLVKDELLLERCASLSNQQQLVLRLISQMEAVGLTPCCSPPATCVRSVNDESHPYDDTHIKKQHELEEKLRSEQEEKQKINRMLATLSAEREHQDLELRQIKNRNKELEERENFASRTIQRMAVEKTQKERLLEDSARRAMRELMETQARLTQKAKKKSLFERLFSNYWDN